MLIIQKESSSMLLPVIEVTCAIIMDKDLVLATRRSGDMPHPLKWEFPGGKLKAGERPEACIIREIREELGIEISVHQLLPSVRHSYVENTIKLIPFICSIRRGEIRLSEHCTYRWLTRSEIDEIDWLEADVEVLKLLKKYLQGRMPV